MNPVICDGASRWHWRSGMTFLVATAIAPMSYALFIRFPYLCATYGWGNAIIAYSVCSLFVALPVAAVELIVGQYYNRCAYQAFKRVAPACQIVGLLPTILGGICYTSYFSVVVAWAARAFVQSLQNPAGLTQLNTTQQFLLNNVVGNNDASWSAEPGTIGAVLVVLLFVTLLTCFTFKRLQRGTSSQSKIIFYSLPLPFFFLCGVTIYAISLSDAQYGIRDYVFPAYASGALLRPRLWAASLGQSLLGVGCGSGLLVAFGSFNPVNRNTLKYVGLLGGVNIACTCLVGLTTSAALGHAQWVGAITDMRKFAADGGLTTAFYVYSVLMSQTSVPRLVGAVIFGAIVLLGVDSIAAMSMALTAQFRDETGSTTLWRYVFISAVVPFLLTPLFCFSTAFRIISSVDMSVVTMCFPLLSIAEVLCVSLLWEKRSLRSKVIERGNSGWRRTRDWFTVTATHSVRKIRKIVRDVNKSQLNIVVAVVELKIIVPVAICLGVGHQLWSVASDKEGKIPYVAVVFVLPTVLFSSLIAGIAVGWYTKGGENSDDRPWASQDDGDVNDHTHFAQAWVAYAKSPGSSLRVPPNQPPPKSGYSFGTI